MLGINVVVKCPYCGKVLNANLGITNYYNYEDRTVFVEYHCDRPFF